jgi:threonine dehydratase
MTAQVERAALLGQEGRALAAEVVALGNQYQGYAYEMGVVWTPLELLDITIPDTPPGYGVQVKNEALQPSESFKFRGATVAIGAAKQAAEEKGGTLTRVVAATDGNHGMAVTAAARIAGLAAADIKMPHWVGDERKDRLRAAGAIVDADGYHTLEQAKAAALAAERPECAYIAPFDAETTMAGAWGVAVEIHQSLQEQHEHGDIDLYEDDITVLMAVAGGGMVAAAAAYFDEALAQGSLGQHFRLKGAQLERSDAVARKLAGRPPLTDATLDKTCKSTALLEPGEKTQAILGASTTFAGIEVVSREETGEAMQVLGTTYGETGPAAALALAGGIKLMREQGQPTDGKRHHIIVVRCGSDHDTPEILAEYANGVSDTFKAELDVNAFRSLSRRHVGREVYGFEEMNISPAEVLRGVWRSPTTRQYIQAEGSRPSAELTKPTGAQQAYLAQLGAWGIEQSTTFY